MMGSKEMKIQQNGLLPILQPLPIPTKGKKWYVALWIWFTARRQWIIVKDYVWMGKTMGFYIPEGFVYDGASIPRLLWWLLSPMGLLLIPALFHDYAYANGYYFRVTRLDRETDDRFLITPVYVSRKDSDYMFRRISIIVNGISGPADIAWVGVRIGGWKTWNEHKESKRKLED